MSHSTSWCVAILVVLISSALKLFSASMPIVVVCSVVGSEEERAQGRGSGS